MFGYVRPLKSELKIREWELYQSAYCGLCHALKKRYGFISRFAVNYDFTFLTILLWAVNDEAPMMCKKNCIAKPIRKKCVCINSNILDFAADASVILLYCKLADEVQDASFFQKVYARLLRRFFKSAYRKASLRYPEFCEYTNECLNELKTLENRNVSSIDATADTFARILEKLSEFVDDAAKKRIVSQILYHLGRYIYLLDAWDDLEDDINSKNYNPIVLRFNIESALLCDEVKNELMETLAQSIKAITVAYDLIGDNKMDGILRNILTMGLPTIVQLVCAGRFNKKEKQINERSV